MTRESDITPYSDSPSSSSSAPTSKSARMRKVGKALKWAGFAGFWIQVFLAVVSAVTLALAIVGICISFRYGKMANKFTVPNSVPPKKSTTIKIVQIAIVISLAGTLITVLGAQTIAGIVLSKTLSLDPGKIFNSQTNTEFVNSLDVFIIQACINIIAGHFAGIVSSLWIFGQIDK